MAAATASSTDVIVTGNKVQVLGTFSAISNTNTWTPGMTTVDACFILNGASGQTVGATYSGGTITFALSGDLANAKVLAIGV